MTEITWIHLSDWHQKGDECDREVILNALVRDIENRARISPNLVNIDFIIFSGDVAFSGKANEYEAAKEKLFEPILRATNRESRDLFIIPGNHDLDRDIVSSLPSDLRNWPVALNEVNNWLREDDKRALILKPFSEFKKFVTSYTNQLTPEYGDKHTFKKGNKEIALLGLNTALICGRFEDSEYGFTHAGEPQIEDPKNETFDCDLKIAVLHHPFSWLNQEDRKRLNGRLTNQCDFILTGHEHTPQQLPIPNNKGFCLHVSTCCSNKRIPDDPFEINAYNFVHFNLETRHVVIFLRRFNIELAEWQDDTKTRRDGKFEFNLNGSISQKKIVPRLEKARLNTIREMAQVAGSSDDETLVGQFMYKLYEPLIIINNLSEKITRDKILETKWPGDVSDPINPIKSAIIESMQKYEEGAAVEGLIAIRDSTNHLLDAASSLDDEQMRKIAEILVYHYLLIGKLAINKDNSYISSNVIDARSSIASKAVEKKFRIIAYRTIETIEEMGAIGAQEEFGKAVEFAIEAMKGIGAIASKQGIEYEYATAWIASFIGKLAVAAINYKLNNEANLAAMTLGGVGLTSAEKGLKFASTSSAGALEKVAKECFGLRCSDIANSAITYLRNIGNLAAKNNIANVVGQVADSFGHLVESAAEQGQYDIIPVITWSIGLIGIQSSAKKELAEPTHALVDWLDRVVKITGQLEKFNKRSEVILQVLKNLGIIGQKAAENGIPNVASRVAFSFGSISSIAIRNNIDRQLIESSLDMIFAAAKETTKCDSSMGSVIFHLGRSYNELQCYAKAEDASRLATEIDHPQSILAWIQLQKSLLGQGKKDEADFALEEYKKRKS